jgi:hypothetical protein
MFMMTGLDDVLTGLLFIPHVIYEQAATVE